MKTSLIIIALFSLILLTGCATKNTTCSDFDCFAAAAENCDPVSGAVTTDINLFDTAIMTSTQEYQLEKVTESCKINIIQKEINMEAIVGKQVPPEAIDAMNQAGEQIYDKQGSCILKNSDLQKLFNEWKDGNYSTEQTTSCSGELFQAEEVE